MLVRNSETRGGAEIKIEWTNKNLLNIQLSRVLRNSKLHITQHVYLLGYDAFFDITFRRFHKITCKFLEVLRAIFS